MIPHINILCLLIKFLILCKNNSITVTKDCRYLKVSIDFTKQSHLPHSFFISLVIAMYSASIVDNITVFCKVAFQLIVQLPIVIIYPIGDLLLARSPTKSESTYPITQFVLLPKWKTSTPLQCFSIYLLTTLTTYIKYGNVQTTAYMSNPNALKWGTCDM